MPTCWIIAGPNGAGKTTFAMEYLPNVASCTHFINADLIAAGLSPLAPERETMSASRLFLAELQRCITNRIDFAFETTLSGRSYLKLINKLNASGWSVRLIYLALPSMKMSKQRVAERVAHGGHNISIKDIERRFSRSLNNLLNEFSGKVDQCSCFMNDSKSPTLIFEQQGKNRKVFHEDYYRLIQKEAEL